MKRILSGMRTTGRLHLGHLVGALQLWLELQREYECYWLLADVQALTTHFKRAKELEESVRQCVIDWLSVGLDPKIGAFVLQSAVREYPELVAYLSFFVTCGMLDRNPTLKEEGGEDRSVMNLGFYGYPASQAADILLFSPPFGTRGAELLVPVGEDQRPHIELTREITRRFNREYGKTFILPDIRVSETPRLLGIFGDEKMSKSKGNAIDLADTPEVVAAKVSRGTTDPNKIRLGDPGNPDVCRVFNYHSVFNAGMKDEIAAGCRSGQLGCVDCKAKLSGALNTMLEPIRLKRAEIEAQPSLVADVVREGTNRARAIGRETMERVRHAMHLDYPSLGFDV